MSATARASGAEPTPPGDRVARALLSRAPLSRALPSRPLRAVPGRVRGAGPAARVPAARAATPELRLLPGGASRTPRAAARRRAPFAVLLVALLVLTTIGLLVLNTAIAVNSLRATELRTANAEKAEEVQEL
jgi:hypothetical protein